MQLTVCWKYKIAVTKRVKKKKKNLHNGENTIEMVAQESDRFQRGCRFGQCWLRVKGLVLIVDDAAPHNLMAVTYIDIEINDGF